MSLTGGVRAIGYFSYSLIYGWSVQNQMSFPFNASFSFIIIAVTSVGLLLMVIFSLSAKVNKRVEEDLLIMKIN